MRSLDAAERRARLARRHLLAPGSQATDVESATAAMVCLHATDPATVYLSARARVVGMVAADLDRALYLDRSLVKHLAMRRTLFVFPRSSLRAVQAAASERVAGIERRRLIRDIENAGLFPDGEHWLAAASAAVVEALAEGGEMAFSQLRSKLPVLEGSIAYGEGRSWGGQVSIGPRVLTCLSAQGRIVRAGNNGAWTTSRPTWATTASWLGHDIEGMSQAQGLAELVAHWLRAFGPGTATDIKWWLGSTLTAVRAALHDVTAVEVDLDGQRGYVLPGDLEPTEPVEPWAALLPALDPTTMGWAARDWYLGPHRSQLFDTSGNAGPTAWWDGRIVGGWRQTEDATVVVELLEDVGAEGDRALQAEATRMTRWLDGVRVGPRFPSPLSRRGATD